MSATAVESRRPRGSAIGCDIGGTKIACGVVASDGSVREAPVRIPTPTDPAEVVRAISEIVHKFRARHSDMVAIGVGAAGLVEWPTGRIIWAPNNTYRDLPLKRLLEESCGLPTIVENDANAAAWAEMRIFSGSRYMIFVTVGTGVGGGLILDGNLYRGSTGIGGEIGHLTVDPTGDAQCGCGNTGCLEAVASGTALGRYGAAAAAADSSSAIATLAGDPLKVTGETVTAAALAGDPLARSLVARAGRWLGIGVASLVAVLDVEKISVGGGVSAAGELLLAPARESLGRYLFARHHRQPPDLVLARAGADAGWIGAGLLAITHAHEAAPG